MSLDLTLVAVRPVAESRGGTDCCWVRLGCAGGREAAGLTSRIFWSTPAPTRSTSPETNLEESSKNRKHSLICLHSGDKEAALMKHIRVSVRHQGFVCYANIVVKFSHLQ